jgi:hypothetical protein
MLPMSRCIRMPMQVLLFPGGARDRADCWGQGQPQPDGDHHRCEVAEWPNANVGSDNSSEDHQHPQELTKKNGPAAITWKKSLIDITPFHAGTEPGWIAGRMVLAAEGDRPKHSPFQGLVLAGPPRLAVCSSASQPAMRRASMRMRPSIPAASRRSPQSVPAAAAMKSA